MKQKDLSLLQCPYCSSRFVWSRKYIQDDEHVEYATVSCECDEFPVLAGILFVRKSRSKELVVLLRSGKYEEALLRLVATKWWMQFSWTLFFLSWLLKCFPLLSVAKKYGKERIFFILSFFLGKQYLEYYSQRNSKTSILAYYIPFFFLAKTDLLWIDIGSGMGGAHHSLLELRPETKIVGVEADFKLLLLNRVLRPQLNTLLICANASDGSVIRAKADIVTCIDSLNYIENQQRVLDIYFTKKALRKNGMAVASNLAEEIILPDYEYFFSLRKTLWRSLSGVLFLLSEESLERAAKTGLLSLKSMKEKKKKRLELYAVLYFPGGDWAQLSKQHHFQVPSRYTKDSKITWNMPRKSFLSLNRKLS